MAEPTIAAPPPAPAPAKPGAPNPAAAPQSANPHQPSADAGNAQETPEAAWMRKAGFVKRTEGDGYVRRLKVDGKEVEFDPTDPESWNGVTTSQTAKRFITDAQKTKRAWDDVISAFKADPAGTMREMAKAQGLSFEEVERKIAQEVIRREKLTPEAREIEKLRAEKAEREQAEAQEREERASQQTQQWAQRWDAGIRKAMAQEGVSEEPEMLFLMSNVALQEYRKNPGQGVDLGAIARRIRARVEELGAAHIAKYDDEKLLTKFKDDLRKRLRGAEAKALEAAQAAPPPALPPTLTTEARSASKPQPTNGKKKHRSEAEKRAALDALISRRGGRNVPLP